MSRRRNRDRTQVKVRDEWARTKLAAAWTAIRDHRLDEARQLVETVLDRYETHPSALLVAAMIAYESHKVTPTIEADGATIRPLDVAAEFAAHALEVTRGDPWPDAHWMRALILARQSRWSDALEAAETFRRLAPGRAAFLVDYAGILSALGRFEDAMAAYEAARGHPGVPDAVVDFNLAMVYLGLGRWREGFALYERRHAVSTYPHEGGRHYATDDPTRQWHGEAMPGQRLLVYWEQGLGDQILLWAFLPWVVATSHATVILETHGPLVRLAFEDFPELVIVKDGDPLPSWDRHVGVFSLPHLYGAEPAGWPA